MPLPVTPESRAPAPTQASQGPSGEDLGFWRTLGAAFTAVAADASNADQVILAPHYREILDTLEDLGYNRNQFVKHYGIRHLQFDDRYDLDAIYDAVRTEQKNGHFSDLASNRDIFEAMIFEENRPRVERAERIMESGGFWPSFIGGAAGAMADPLNIATLPAGGFGKAAGVRIASQFPVQAAIQTSLLPAVAEQRRIQGRRDLSAEEGGMMVLFAGLGGAGFQTLGEGLRVGVLALYRRLPENVRRRLNPASEREADIVDAMIADVEARGDMATQAERDAADLLAERRRERQQSLLGENGASRALNEELLGAAMDDMIARGPSEHGEPGARRAVAQMQRGGLDGDGVEARFMARVRQAESGGNDAARAATSSATGRYQFIDATWLRLFRARYGSRLSETEILALRENGAIQDQLMRDLTAENAAHLREWGESVTQGNLYLLHFAGPGNARKIFQADPRARAADVLPANVIEANGFLRDMSAGDVIRWAHGKMGNLGSPPRAGARAELGEGIDGAIARNEAERADIQSRIDEALVAEDAARAAMRADPNDPARAALGNEPVMVRSAGDDVFDPQAKPISPDANPQVDLLLPPLRRIAQDTRQSLNDIAALARDLDANETDLRAALDALVEQGEIAQNSKTGTFMRKSSGTRNAANTARPRTLIEFLAERGGLNDWDGDLQSMGIRASDRRFGKKIIRNAKRTESGGVKPGEGDYGFDTAFIAAREAGYFPEFNGPLAKNYIEALDEAALLLEAIDDELAGAVRYSDGDWGRLAEYGLDGKVERDLGGVVEDEYFTGFSAQAIADFERMWTDAGLDAADVDDVFFGNAARLFIDGHVDSPEEAFALAARMEYDDALRAAAEEGLGDYGKATGPRDEDWDEIWARENWQKREAERLSDGGEPDGGIGAGRESQSAASSESRPRSESASGRGQNAFDEGKRLADLSDEDRAPFADPTGEAAARQAESLEHDLRAGIERAAVPPLEDGKGSWVVRDRETGEVVFETFNKATVEKVNTKRYEILTARQHLVRLNRETSDAAPTTASPVIARLEADGWTRNGLEFTKRFEGLAEPGTVSDGSRVVTLRLDERQRYLERLDGFETARDVDLRQYPDDPDAAIRELLGDGKDPNIAARQRQETQLRSEAPLRGENATGQAQDGTMGLALFDEADQPQFRLSDEGEPESAASMLDRLDAEAAELKTIQDCLK